MGRARQQQAKKTKRKEEKEEVEVRPKAKAKATAKANDQAGPEPTEDKWPRRFRHRLEQLWPGDISKGTVITFAEFQKWFATAMILGAVKEAEAGKVKTLTGLHIQRTLDKNPLLSSLCRNARVMGIRKPYRRLFKTKESAPEEKN